MPGVIHEQALKFVLDHRDWPFFAYPPYTLPHVELTVPEASRKPYEGRWPKLKRDDPRPGYLGSDDAYADFAGMISHLGDQVGDVLALVKELGIDRKMLALCEVCDDLKLTVLFHCDNRHGTDASGLPGLEKVLTSFPDVNFLGHSPRFWALISGDLDAKGLGGYPKSPAVLGGALDCLFDARANLWGEVSATSGSNALSRAAAANLARLS